MLTNIVYHRHVKPPRSLENHIDTVFYLSYACWTERRSVNKVEWRLTATLFAWTRAFLLRDGFKISIIRSLQRLNKLKKTITLFSLIILIGAVFVVSTPSYSHVVPEDELRNQVYLTTRQALQKVFAGENRIKKETRSITASQKTQVEELLQRKIKDRRIEFFSVRKDGLALNATVGKIYANSHPVTKGRFIVLMDSQGQVQECHIMEYKGPQRAEIVSSDFLDQFSGKSTESDFSTVTSNQGSTPPVKALIQEVQKIPALYKVLYIDSGK